MKELVILALCVVAVHCAARRDRPDFDCDRICRRFGYKPKCSTEDKQYDNSCFLECQWKYEKCDGRCPCRRNQPDPRPQPPAVGYYDNKCNWCYTKDTDWVCTYDSGTYRNKCEAECDGKYVWYDGVCIE